MQYSVSTKNIDCCCYHQKFRFLSHFGRLFISVIRFLSLKRTRTIFMIREACCSSFLSPSPNGPSLQLVESLELTKYPHISKFSHKFKSRRWHVDLKVCCLQDQPPPTTQTLSPSHFHTVLDTFLNHHSIKKTEVGDGGSEVEIGIVGGVSPLNSNCADHM